MNSFQTHHPLRSRALIASATPHQFQNLNNAYSYNQQLQPIQQKERVVNEQTRVIRHLIEQCMSIGQPGEQWAHYTESYSQSSYRCHRSQMLNNHVCPL